MAKRNNTLTGKQFGALRVIQEQLPQVKHQRRVFICVCTCGTKDVPVAQDALSSGKKTDCGCGAGKPTPKKQGRPRKYSKDTLASSIPEYRIWRAIQSRCFNKNHLSFKYYGARGVEMCDEWRNDFTAFYNHIGPRPSSEHSVDRIYNSLGYEPGNVKWSTRREQMNNTSANTPLTFKGVTLNPAQWARKMKMSPCLLHSRIKAGWSLEDAIMTPVRRYSRKTGTQQAQQAA